MIDSTIISKIDSSGMYELIKSFPEQVEAALEIAAAAKLSISSRKVQNIVLTGLGGSAIGGDILRSYSANQLRVPMQINRSYTLPGYVNRNTLVVVSSYSGETEETISAYLQAKKKGAQIIVISSGGTIGKRALRNSDNWIKIPGGLPPRAALGYSFFTLLSAFDKVGIIKVGRNETMEVILLLKSLRDEYSRYENAPEPLRIASLMKNSLPIIYSASDHFDAVNLRWRGQISENAKAVAYGNFLPEMNHNEIVGYATLEDILKRFFVIFLRDVGDHPRVRTRFDLMKEIISNYCGSILEIHSKGKYLLSRMFSLIYLGDWVSYYLAIEKGVDPTPVKNIDILKKQLAEVKR
ncbi:MAG: bifunctional phosphoglucose/phosphomannose isomerase [Candidatus Kryptoniota bacterium]